MDTLRDLIDTAVKSHQAGKLDEAESMYRAALTLDPDQFDALHLLGLLEFGRGRAEEARDLVEHACRVAPSNTASLQTLGRIRLALGLAAKAQECFVKVVSMEPGNAKAHYLLGEALRRQERYPEAIESYCRALAIAPHMMEALNNLGAAYRLNGNLDLAIVNFRETLRVRPDWADGYNNLGTTLSEAGQPEEATACFRRAIELDPDSVSAHVSLGRELMLQGELTAAREEFVQAIKRDPVNVRAHSNLLVCMNYDPCATRAELFEAHLRWARTLTNATPAATGHANRADPCRRLRIGYVSPDFYRHPIASFLEPVLDNHNHAGFEIFCYSDTAIPDAVTERLRAHADCWRDIRDRTDRQLSDTIAADRIDILVDLTGHLADNRLLMFARKPAPVQISWLGYQNTTGLGAIDYRFTDRVCAPPGEEQFSTEKLICLTPVFACYRPPHDAPMVSMRPDGPVTFGSFHNVVRLNDRVLDLWADVLNTVPDSRLLVFRTTLLQTTVDRLGAALAGRGIDLHRVTFLASAPPGENYLSVYGRVDITLDTFPWSGHTSACEALWMGVPVVTLRGDRPAGRMVASTCEALGMNDLVADSADSYVSIAARLAADRPRLAALRSTLRDTLQKSVLCDAPRFTSELENHYRAVWRAWCVERTKR